jgi:hypothetical protein
MPATAQRSIGGDLNPFFSLIVGFVLKLFLAMMAAVFAISLLGAGLVYLAFASVRFLLTGRKPAFAVVFSQMRQYRQSAADGVWPAPGRHRSGHMAGHAPGRAPQRPAAHDVVDVEVREIADTPKPDPQRQS